MKNKQNLQYLIILLLSLGLGLLVRTTCFSIHKITGSSMTPTFNEGAFLLTIEKPLMNLLRMEFERGDIVIAEIRNMPPLAKRLIGLPKDELWVEDYKIILNGSPLKENFTRRLKNKIDCGYSEAFNVAENHFFLIGDNFCESFDSRYIGAVSSKEVQSKVIWTIYSGKSI